MKESKNGAPSGPRFRGCGVNMISCSCFFLCFSRFSMPAPIGTRRVQTLGIRGWRIPDAGRQPRGLPAVRAPGGPLPPCGVPFNQQIRFLSIGEPLVLVEDSWELPNHQTTNSNQQSPTFCAGGDLPCQAVSPHPAECSNKSAIS